MRGREMMIGGAKIAMALATVAIAFAPSYQALAWGPERETFRWESAAPYRTINSITDNPSIGDERNFVRVRKVGDPKFGDEVSAVVGQEYEVQIFYHNNASRTLNADGSGIADGVRANSILQEFVAKGTRGQISATITAANTTPASVWDEAYVTTTEDVYLRYVSGSIYIHSGGPIDGKQFSSENLFTSLGASISYWDSEEAQGVLPGCNEYSGYISYKFRVDKPGFEMDKTVSRDAKNEWVESIAVAPGEILDFKIRYKNTGTTEQNDVVLVDVLPTGLEYLLGTSFLINGSAPAGEFVADGIFTTGLNIGRYQPGSEATLTYKVRVPAAESLQCGSNKYVNSASVVTGNGSAGDKVDVDVVRECVPTELPKTGPADVALMVVAVMAIGVGGMYWYRSTAALRAAKKAVGLEKDGEE